MGHRKPPQEPGFEESVKRLVSAVGQGIVDTVGHGIDSARERREAQRQAEMERKHRARALKYAGRTKAEGWAYASVGLLLFVMALIIRPDLWWLVFPGFAIGIRGVRILGHKAQERRNAPMPPVLPKDPREERLDRACDGLLAALRDSPQTLAAVFNGSEKVVTLLQSSARDLLRRERTLRELVRPEEEGRLRAERDALAQRVAQATDEVARSRFEAALVAVDEQIAKRRDVARNADRLEAEHTRLIATLEGLLVNVVRLRSADATSAHVAGAGLQESLDALRSEVDALADAAEEMNADDWQKVGGRTRERL